MKFFNREEDNKYDAQREKLIDYIESISDVEQAIAENISLDDRVSRERAEIFLSDSALNHPVTGLHDALENAKKGSRSDALESSLNQNNFVYFPNKSVEIPAEWPPETSLVHIKALWENEIGEITRLSGLDAEQWLQENKGKLTIESQDILAKAIAKVSDEWEKKNQGDEAKRLVWVSLKSDFQALCLSESPESWMEAVGLGADLMGNDPLWVLRMEYPINGVVSALLRPSILEAGDYEWHFPSPAKWSCDAGGRCCLLRSGVPEGTTRLPEYLHPYQHPKGEHLIQLEKFEAVNYRLEDLVLMRNVHTQWLENGDSTPDAVPNGWLT